MKNIDEIVESVIRKYVFENGRYYNTATPHNSRLDVSNNLGRNPLYADNGGHSVNDVVSQVSTFDRNGRNFTSNGNNIVVSDNKFLFYKVNNFGSDKVDSTMSIFGKGANGEKELRRAIDTINGAATRNYKSVSYRTITSETYKSISERSGYMSKTFWEFSLDDGITWYILKPEPIQNMKQSKLVVKTNESKIRLSEAAMQNFSTKELQNLPTYKAKVEYCKRFLGPSVGNGSSRLVFQIDDNKVLKLAKNHKGTAQNEFESEWYKKNFSCFPEIYECDDNGTYIICEYVLPAKEQDFEHCLNMSFDRFCDFIATCYKQYARRCPFRTLDWDTFEELVDSNEILSDIDNYMRDYQLQQPNELMQLRNYGMVRRDGEDMIVLLDHGLSNEIFDEYYAKN